MVTGVIAQMMQANPWLKINPTAAKAKLLLGADHSKVVKATPAPDGNSNHLVENYLWNKSGAGLVDAFGAVKHAHHLDYFIKDNTPIQSENYYFRAGQKIRLVMTFDKRNNVLISSANDMDNIDVYIKKANGTVVASSASTRNNVEIIEYTFTTNGYYKFEIDPVNIIDTKAGVRSSVAWRLTSPNTVYISNATELQAINNDLTGNYELRNDIDLQSASWTPIASGNTPFTGRLNGNGLSINNLHVYQPNGARVGLFGYADGALFENININGVDIIGYDYAGGLVAYSDNTDIDNCHIASGTVEGLLVAGGLAGSPYGASITNSSSDVVVYGVRSTASAGGLLGECASANIERCYAKGGADSGNTAGGLIGSIFGSGVYISDCYVNASVDGSTYAGGIVGSSSNAGNITNCYFTGQISGTTKGGINAQGTMTVTNSYFNSTTTGITSPTSQAKTDALMKHKSTFANVNWDFVDTLEMSLTYPGLQNPNRLIYISTPAQLQRINQNLSGHYELINDIDLSGVSNWTPIGTYTAPFTGTLKGNGFKISNLSISQPTLSCIGLFGYASSATFSDIAIENANVQGKDYVGGLVAQCGNTNIARCYAEGNISGSYSVGGLIGMVYSDSYISNCYAEATVTGGSSMGGLVGFIYGGNVINCYFTRTGSGGSGAKGLLDPGPSVTVTNSYFNKTTTGINTPQNQAKTDTQMKQQSTYSGWDFTNVWQMSSAYPILRN